MARYIVINYILSHSFNAEAISLVKAAKEKIKVEWWSIEAVHYATEKQKSRSYKLTTCNLEYTKYNLT